MPPCPASGKMLNSASGSRRASSNELDVGAITSSSPLATSTGCLPVSSAAAFPPPPRQDGRHLGLNGFLTDRRVERGSAFFQTPQKISRGGLAVARLCKEQEMLRLLVGGLRLGESVLQNRTDIQDALAACRTGARKDDLAHELRLLLRNDLGNETTERETQQIDLAEPKRSNERDGVP